MSEPFLAEIKIISWNFAPKGWAFCNGQLLPINQNQALFSILGTTYGGDGRVNFALPNLQGRSPIHVGNNHVPNANSAAASVGPAAGNFWSQTGSYAPSADSAMNPASILPTGGSQAHENMSPYLVLNFIIALQGIFPSQN